MYPGQAGVLGAILARCLLHRPPPLPSILPLHSPWKCLSKAQAPLPALSDFTFPQDLGDQPAFASHPLPVPCALTTAEHSSDAPGIGRECRGWPLPSKPCPLSSDPVILPLLAIRGMLPASALALNNVVLDVLVFMSV